MLRQRIFTALVALSVLGIALFVVPPYVARIVIATMFLAGAWEWGGFLFQDNRGGRFAYVVFIGVLIGAMFLQIENRELVESVFKAALAWWSGALVWMFFYPTPIAKPIKWVGGALVLVPAWAALDIVYAGSRDLLLYLLLIVWVADIGAYFVGKGFGRVKLAPQISPGKSWEGVLGGLTAVTLLAMVGARYFDVDIAAMIPFCLAVAMLSIVGDLTVSMFKREAGVKDSGSLFPGHGGVLDRIDSVTAGAPLFALAMTWIGLQ
jgi:phosphatidate cytidylyltransferase